MNPEIQQGEQGITIEKLVEFLERARQGDRRLSGQLFGIFAKMRLRQDIPEKERALADVAARILFKDPAPDLSGLPEDWASLLQALIDRLAEQG